MIKIFRKFENFKFYPKITKTGVIKNIEHSINSRNYAATSKSRPLQYKYKSPKQFELETELKGSKTT